MFMTHHRFAARLQTQYQTSRFEGVRREVTEHCRFGIALSKLKQPPSVVDPILGRRCPYPTKFARASTASAGPPLHDEAFAHRRRRPARRARTDASELSSLAFDSPTLAEVLFCQGRVSPACYHSLLRRSLSIAGY